MGKRLLCILLFSTQSQVEEEIITGAEKSCSPRNSGNIKDSLLMIYLYMADKFLMRKTVRKHISCATAILSLTTTMTFSWESIKVIVATRKKSQTNQLAHNKESDELGDIEAGYCGLGQTSESSTKNKKKVPTLWTGIRTRNISYPEAETNIIVISSSMGNERSLLK